jgi:hypothetical protein
MTSLSLVFSYNSGKTPIESGAVIWMGHDRGERLGGSRQRGDQGRAALYDSRGQSRAGAPPHRARPDLTPAPSLKL